MQTVSFLRNFSIIYIGLSNFLLLYFDHEFFLLKNRAANLAPPSQKRAEVFGTESQFSTTYIITTQFSSSGLPIL